MRYLGARVPHKDVSRCIGRRVDTVLAPNLNPGDVPMERSPGTKNRAIRDQTDRSRVFRGHRCQQPVVDTEELRRVVRRESECWARARRETSHRQQVEVSTMSLGYPDQQTDLTELVFLYRSGRDVDPLAIYEEGCCLPWSGCEHHVVPGLRNGQRTLIHRWPLLVDGSRAVAGCHPVESSGRRRDGQPTSELPIILDGRSTRSSRRQGVAQAHCDGIAQHKHPRGYDLVGPCVPARRSRRAHQVGGDDDRSGHAHDGQNGDERDRSSGPTSGTTYTVRTLIPSPFRGSGIRAGDCCHSSGLDQVQPPEAGPPRLTWSRRGGAALSTTPVPEHPPDESSDIPTGSASSGPFESWNGPAHAPVPVGPSVRPRTPLGSVPAAVGDGDTFPTWDDSICDLT